MEPDLLSQQACRRGGLCESSTRVQGLTLEGVRQKLKEFHDAIGEEGGEEDAARQRAKVMNLLTGLGYEKPEEPAPQPLPEAPANGTAGAVAAAIRGAWARMASAHRQSTRAASTRARR